mmetsp:Transcript_5476/g.8508  ORF Transcript_5476/g.8508 Transcript_5476/m.8508 type:complete len:88 (+) Transcript_5476:87-350(+)
MLPYEFDLEVRFPKDSHASIVCNALSVDEELQPPTSLVKTMTVTGNVLKIHFAASELRLLRVSVSSFLDFLHLSTRTLAEFGDTAVS